MKCEWPTCKDEAKEGKKYCFMHGRVYEGAVVESNKPAPIAKHSVKGMIKDREYKKLVKMMLDEDDRCEMKVKGVCTGKAQGLHHVQKRNKQNLMDIRNLKRACLPCNSFAESNSSEAKELGLVKSRFL